MSTSKQVRIRNMGLERVRYTVVRPALPLKVSWKPGPIAAGMHTNIQVHLELQDLRPFSGEIEVRIVIFCFAYCAILCIVKLNMACNAFGVVEQLSIFLPYIVLCSIY